MSQIQIDIAVKQNISKVSIVKIVKSMTQTQRVSWDITSIYYRFLNRVY